MNLRTWSCLRAPNVSAEVRPLALFLPLALSLAVMGQAEDRWKVQYFYDKSDSVFDIRDIRCPNAQRCIAAGVIDDGGHERGAMVLTNDGGLHWTLSNVKEHPVALFFLDESSGWMATDRGIWLTQEGGRSWNKLESLKGVVDLNFLDASHGYAIGFPKAVYETNDGGHKWVKLAAAAEAPGDPQHTTFDCIAFAGAHGLIAGSIDTSEPVPIRRNPATGALELTPGDNTVVLETNDSGKTWTSKGVRFDDGKLVKLAISDTGLLAMTVVYPSRRAKFPSAVLGVSPEANEGQTLFAQRGRVVLDIALLPHARAFIAAVEPPGNSNEVPIPGKLKMLESEDLNVWTEMNVDYRTVARAASMAAPDAEHVWVATDTGMILNLTKDASGAH